ncbi:FIG022979: MoxR-like ATPases [hydrothermal vent metagenome]|uniref:FIG022979: MoxR-like ATPases n=1 Tax=hydrothermal vent metagenome TaxID=652676 RepID=A0A3B0WUC1_9ZZZZ
MADNMDNTNIRQLESTTVLLDDAITRLAQVILGKDHQIKLALTCLLAKGHCLIEDQPGVGKTTLAHAMAQVVGLDFHRIQFTSDLLPADVLGVSVFNREQSSFEFHPGPIFSHFILADEINRATPKTQSALLEAMEEHQVTVEGETRKLPEPFFVIATQNPTHQIGTYPLPESQLDRFLMRIDLGYPNADAERQLLEGEDRRAIIKHLKPVFTKEQLFNTQQLAAAMHASPAILDYIQAILKFTRQTNAFEFGLSPRGGLALLNAAKAYALIDSKKYILPEHVQAVLPAVANHRLPVHLDNTSKKRKSAAAHIMESVSIT